MTDWLSIGLITGNLAGFYVGYWFGSKYRITHIGFSMWDIEKRLKARGQ